MNLKKSALTVLFTLNFVFAFSQQHNDERPQWSTNTPGHELELAANHYYLGLGMQVTGSIAISISSGRYYYSGGVGAGLLGGIALLVAGTILSVESHSHIKKAGILLDMQNKKKLSLGSSRDGLNLCYQF
jgi:hypothetical protein